MVDFKKLAAKMEARLTPEERAIRDVSLAKEAEWDQTREEITARFDRLVWKHQDAHVQPRPAIGFNRRLSSSAAQTAKPGRRDITKMERHIAESWEKVIDIRIEARADGKDILRFIGGETGHEAFHLDEEMAASLLERDHDRLFICAGTPHRYNACSVELEAVIDYVLRQRPHLFPDADVKASRTLGM